jgi:hypothetical protein
MRPMLFATSLDSVSAPCQYRKTRKSAVSPRRPRMRAGKEIRPHLLAQRMKLWLNIARCPIMNRRVPTWRARAQLPRPRAQVP